MIMTAKQTASNIAQTYEVSIDGTYVYAGSLGRFHRFQPIELMDKNNTPVLKGRWYLSKWIHYLPFAWTLEKHTVTRKCVITSSTGETASIGFTRQRAFEDVYTLWLPCGEELEAYAVAVGDYEYVSIYRKDHQVALLELYLTAIDYCYIYKMYVLEEIAEQKAWLTFLFCIMPTRIIPTGFTCRRGLFAQKSGLFPEVAVGMILHGGKYISPMKTFLEKYICTINRQGIR